MSKAVSTLITSLSLAFAAAGLLVMIAQFGLSHDLARVLMILVGMVAVSSLLVLQRFLDSAATTMDKAKAIGPMSTRFDEQLVQARLYEETTEATRVYGKAPASKKFVWDVSPDQLLANDTALALAKLRIELERELRRVAYENGIDVRARPVSVRQLAQDLAIQGVLPPAWLEAIDEILPVTNEAIHGVGVPGDVAGAVVRVGNQLLEQLRFLGGRRQATADEESRTRMQALVKRALEHQGLDVEEVARVLDIPPEKLLGDATV